MCGRHHPSRTARGRHNCSSRPSSICLLIAWAIESFSRDCSVFESQMSQFLGHAQRNTLYASKKDLALRVHGYERGGQAGVAGLDSIDASAVNFGQFGHSYFHEQRDLLLGSDEWIIDGFDGIKSTWERLEAADTLIHVDLPLVVHAWWVTKRLVKGLLVSPEGWPENSPVISSSISSYRVLWACHSHLTPKYRAFVSEVAHRKRVFRLRSPREVKAVPRGNKERDELGS